MVLGSFFRLQGQRTLSPRPFPGRTSRNAAPPCPIVGWIGHLGRTSQLRFGRFMTLPTVTSG